MSPVGRVLRWEGCHNVRDLGGLETASGGRTRHAGVVRADNVRGLTEAGWASALAHGVRHVVDLRHGDEGTGDAAAHPEVGIVSVPLRDQDAEAARAFDERMLAADDIAPVFAAAYVGMLETYAPRFAAAATAVADAPAADCVVVHCFAGKDRTGLVAALILSLADVPDAVVADDYAASDPGVHVLSTPWFAASVDAEQLELRRRICRTPREAMLETLAWVRERGGAEAYLRDAGLSAAGVEALCGRLVG